MSPCCIERFLSPPVLMHVGLLCGAFRLSVGLSVCLKVKGHMGQCKIRVPYKGRWAHDNVKLLHWWFLVITTLWHYHPDVTKCHLIKKISKNHEKSFNLTFADMSWSSQRFLNWHIAHLGAVSDNRQKNTSYYWWLFWRLLAALGKSSMGVVINGGYQMHYLPATRVPYFGRLLCISIVSSLFICINALFQGLDH